MSEKERCPEIRNEIRKFCSQYGDEYWRKLDKEHRYPEQFVDELTQAGWLAALIPEQYGGSGLTVTEASVILEEINRSGGNAAACHAQMYIMGSLLRHGSAEQKQRYLPRIASGEIRLQAFGVTEPDAGSDTTHIRTTARERATTISSTAAKSSPPGYSIPICSSFWPGPLRMTRAPRERWA